MQTSSFHLQTIKPLWFSFGHPVVKCSVWVQSKSTKTYCLRFSINWYELPVGTAVRSEAWSLTPHSVKSLRNITKLLFYAQIFECYLILLKGVQTHTISLQWKTGHPRDHPPFKRTIKPLHAVLWDHDSRYYQRREWCSEVNVNTNLCLLHTHKYATV